MITKADLELILGKNITNVDELTTAIKNYVDSSETKLSQAITDGDDAIRQLIGGGIEELDKIKQLLDILDGIDDDVVDLPTVLAGIQGSITTGTEERLQLKGRIDTISQTIADLSNRVSSLEGTTVAQSLLFDTLATGLESLATEIKKGTAKFAITATDSDNSGEDDNVL